MSELLDRLAMEVSEWGVGDPPKDLRWVTIDLNSLKTYARAPDGKLIEEADWIQRRKELINEPSDEDAPFWANWKAQDGSGVWRWFKDKVSSSVMRESWYAYDRTAVASIGTIPAGHSWRKTLREVERAGREVTGAQTLSATVEEVAEQARAISIALGRLNWSLGGIREQVATIEGEKQTPLTQRKIQSVIDSGEYREMEGATVLVGEEGRAAIVSSGGAFYWVDNDSMAREWDLAGGDDE